MYYPEKLPLHKHYKWQFHEARRNNAGIVRSYYDLITDSLGMHIHDFYEINIITSGNGRHYLANRNIPTDIGDVFVIPPNVPHGYHSNGNLTVYHILLSKEFSVKYFDDLKELNGFQMLFEIEPILRLNTDKAFYLTLEKEAFDKLKATLSLLEAESDGGHDSDLRRCFHTLTLIATLCKNMNIFSLAPTDNVSNNQTVSVIKSIAYIENNYNQKLNLKTISENCKMSYSTYLRFFKKLTGMTPIKYQNICRIKRAENLLIKTNETVLSIALTCGFYDSAHFIREFKKNNGISPAEYRSKQHIN